METKQRSVYNATRGCSLSFKVTVADSALQPLKVLRVLVKELALDAESGLWLTPLLNAPKMMRLFPFDLVYLDGDLRVIQGVELLPHVEFPRFNELVASALILPLYTLSSTETHEGDQLIICSVEEMESRIAELASQTAIVPVEPAPIISVESATLPATRSLELPGMPSPIPRAPFQLPVPQVAQGTGFTVALHTSWRIANSTVSAAHPEVIDAIELIDRIEQEFPVATVSEPTAQPEAAETVESPLEVAVYKEVNTAETQNPGVEGKLFHVEHFQSAESAFKQNDVQMDESGITAEVKQNIVSTGEKEQSSKSKDDLEVIPRSGSEDVWAANSTRATENLRSPEHMGALERLFPNQNISTSANAESVSPRASSLAKLAVKPGTSVQAKEKDSLKTRVKRWLNAEGRPEERRKATRLSLPGLVVFDVASDDPTPHEVGDVSPTGLYLRTEQRWPKGDLISLSLQRKGSTEKGSDHRIAVQAEAVRWGEDGVGLTFVLPDEVEFHPWRGLQERRTHETEAEYFVREFRMARAMGFLRRICPPAVDEIGQMFHNRLSNKRVASAVEIAIKAEELLAQIDNPEGVLAHPNVVVRILDDGSWAEVDWIQRLWAGLLVTSCTADGQDKSNLVFVELLDKLTPIHLRILSAACRKGHEVLSEGGSTSTLTLYFTAEELIEATGSHSLLKIQQTISHLSTFGLLAGSARSSYVPITEKTKTTPTTLGLEMHARCHGRR